ncbi:MAG: hypothetical protein IPM33_11210 [Phycisphaerales bacterium]|nr:hypothetical protein [Phycisphaerales bacterium]
MLCSLLSLVVLLALIAGLLVGGCGFTVGRTKEACCKVCKYPAAGLPLVRCPECGDDWASQGVRQPGARILFRPSAPVRIVCRTLLLGMVAVPTYGHLLKYSSREYRWVSLTGSSPTDLFSSLHVRALGSHDRHYQGAMNPSCRPVLVLKGTQGEATLRVLDSRLRATVTDPDGNSTRTTDGLAMVDVRRWMSAAGLDEGRDEFDATADELRLLITNLAVGGNVPGLESDNRAASIVPIAYTGYSAESWQMPKPLVLIPFVMVTLTAWFLLSRDILWARGTQKRKEPENESAGTPDAHASGNTPA